MLLPPLLPIFPLPNAVLFPNVFLPLHIFEPRYREMVRDALGGDRLIGMVLLRPEGLKHDDGCPPVYAVGCAGLITHAALLEDGRYNIILRGLEKFRILGEDHDLPYRRARIEPILESASDDERQVIRGERRKLEALLRLAIEHHGAEPHIPSAISDEDMVNALSQYLHLEPVEKQALLERDSLLARCESLIELLEMKVMVAKHHSRTDWTH